MKNFLKWIIVVCIVIFIGVAAQYLVDEVILRNRISSSVIVQKNLPGIPKGSKIKIISSGAILINDKAPTEEQWDTLMKQSSKRK